MIRPTDFMIAQSIPLIEWLAPAMMAVGLLLLIILAVLVARRPKSTAPLVGDQPLLTAEDLIDARQELQDERHRVAELIAVAQRLASKSDEKAALLNQLISQAEERIAELRSGKADDSAAAGSPEKIGGAAKNALSRSTLLDAEPTRPSDAVEVVITAARTGESISR